MQSTPTSQQEEAQRLLAAASDAFELGGPEALPGVIESANAALNLLETEALDKAGSTSKPLVGSIVLQTRAILQKLKPGGARADLRVALLCVALLVGVAGHPWARTIGGGEFCHSCGSHRLVRSNRDTACMDCGWTEKATDEG